MPYLGRRFGGIWRYCIRRAVGSVRHFERPLRPRDRTIKALTAIAIGRKSDTTQKAPSSAERDFHISPGSNGQLMGHLRSHDWSMQRALSRSLILLLIVVINLSIYSNIICVSKYTVHVRNPRCSFDSNPTKGLKEESRITQGPSSFQSLNRKY